MRTTVSPSTVASAVKIGAHERDYTKIFSQQPHLLDLGYEELQAKNMELRSRRVAGATNEDVREEMLSFLSNEKGIRTVILCFTDLEGRLQTLEYEKDFIVESDDNLTFDGSSIKGFTALETSDLRLRPDWVSMRFLPADIFGAGKVLVFGNVCDANGEFYLSDFRSNLMLLARDLKAREGITINVAPEIEGFIFKGIHAEQFFDEEHGFELALASGYFSALPQDELKIFIDKFYDVMRALAFENEKNHPEVAPAQFELNFRYTDALDTADQIQIYKLLARQVANAMGFTACFLPKPIATLNGSGMHTNMSLAKDGVNLFYDGQAENNLSRMARNFITGVLYYAKDLCLIMNSSVNAYRRLDPHYEAPNEIKCSARDRSAMVRIPLGNAKSARMEVRTVAPDANPYLCIYALVQAGLAGMRADVATLAEMEEVVYEGGIDKLPGEIWQAIEDFEASSFMAEVLGEENFIKFADLKKSVAMRSPRALGKRVKVGEIRFHHEVRDQKIWSEF